MRWGGAGLLLLLAGCSRLQLKPTAHYVYVTAKQTFLRDRVAAVSNRTATVANGDRLEILEHGRRFYRVKTEKGDQGWIDEKAVATQQVYDAFSALRAEHAQDLAVASAVVPDEVNLHLKPGRDSDFLFRLPESDKVQLLERATLPKPGVPGAPVQRVTAALVPKAKSGAVKKAGSATASVQEPAAPARPELLLPPVAMEDWWLVRDAQGRTGWLLSRRVDVDAPDALTQYSEGQRFVGAYLLATVHDDHLADASGSSPQGADIPMYATVLNSYAAGLPYDFDQVRVFTWNLKMHRYETAYREKNIEGYLPVTVKMATDPSGKSVVAQTPEPTFTYRVLAADAGPVVPDPVTGLVHPGHLVEKTFRLEGNLVRRVQSPGAAKMDEAHPVREEKKAAAAKGKRKKR